MIALAIIIGAVALVAFGSIPEGMFLALLIFVLAGAIFPPLAIPVGVVVLVALIYKEGVGTKFLAWLGSLGQAQAGPPTQYAPIAPTLPGYTPPPQGAFPKGT